MLSIIVFKTGLTGSDNGNVILFSFVAVGHVASIERSQAVEREAQLLMWIVSRLFLDEFISRERSLTISNGHIVLS